jgi:DNA-binding CsgD family transcriptional regulator
MTRIAVVAPSEKLRASSAHALRSHQDFDLVMSVPERRSASVDVVLVARPRAGVRTGASAGESVQGAALSNREHEILALLADGLINKQIAARLGISTNTVKTHLELLFDKLGVATRAEAVATGVRRGLLLL